MVQRLFLLAYLLLGPSSTASLRLSRSSQTSAGGRNFPEDLFASPAYHINWNAEPITNSSALQLIEQEELEWLKWKEASKRKEKGTKRRVEKAIDVRNRVGSDNTEILPPAFTHHLLRPSESVIYLCSIPSSKSSDSSTSSQTSRDRNSILQSGLDILEPMKSQCLFRTIDWFTYSFCHGTEVRQFRALPGTSGPHGTPAADPTQESFILGRFTPNSEKIYSNKKSNKNSVSNSVSSATTLGSTADSNDKVANTHSVSQSDSEEEEDGAELVEVSRFSSSGDDLAERYLSQKWGGGTRCDITMEPRETEVQFHCNPKIPHAKISLIKETTTCAYVLIIETPKLCLDPAFTVGKDEKVSEVACRAIVPDGWKKGEGEIAGWSGKDQDGSQVIESERYDPTASVDSTSQRSETTATNSNQASTTQDQQTSQSASSSQEALSQDNPSPASSEDKVIDISQTMYVIAQDEEGNYVVESVEDDGGLGDSIFSSIDGLDLETGIDDAMQLVFDVEDLFGDEAGGAEVINEGRNDQGGRREGQGRLGRGFSEQLADILERNLNDRNGGGGVNQDANDVRRQALQDQMKKWNNVLQKLSELSNAKTRGKEDINSEDRQDENKNKERYERLSQKARDQYAARMKGGQEEGESLEAKAHRLANQKLNPPQAAAGGHQQQQQSRRNPPKHQIPLQPKSMKKETESFAEKVGRMYRDKEEKERLEKEQEKQTQKVEL